MLSESRSTFLGFVVAVVLSSTIANLMVWAFPPPFSSSRQVHQHPPDSHSADEGGGPSPWWGVGEMFFTGIIALYAIRQFAEGRRSNERQLRAYVWVRGVAVHNMEVGKIPTIDIEIRNAGQTPAHNMVVMAGAIVEPYPLPDTTPFPRMAGATRTKLVLHPGVEPPFAAAAQWTGTAPLNVEQMALLRAGEYARLFAFICVQYDDVFGKTRETRACFSVKMTPDAARENFFQVAFDWAARHNTAT